MPNTVYGGIHGITLAHLDVVERGLRSFTPTFNSVQTEQNLMFQLMGAEVA